MKIPQHIIKREPQQVQDLFTFWYDIMDRKVEFWPLKGEFDIHTEGHCERVLLLALKIGARRRLSDRQMEALCHASIFHDTRRLNNYLDKGHGERAASYYKEEARQMGITFLPEAMPRYVSTIRMTKTGKRSSRNGQQMILKVMRETI